MPHFTIPRSPDGYTLKVVIGLHAAEIAALQAAGQPVPWPVIAQALLDTASDLTAVTPRVLGQLGIQALAGAKTHTAGGMVNVSLYMVSLSLADPTGAPHVVFEQPEWVVTELLHTPPQIDVLLGLDFADRCLLILDGPGQRFLLGF